MTKENFNKFLGTLVNNSLPDERLVYQVEGSAIVDELYAGRNRSTVQADGTVRFEFGGGISSENVIQFVAAATATFEFIKKVDQWLRSRKQADVAAELADQWKAQLIKAGVSPAAAEKITKSNEAELRNHLKL